MSSVRDWYRKFRARHRCAWQGENKEDTQLRLNQVLSDKSFTISDLSDDLPQISWTSLFELSQRDQVALVLCTVGTKTTDQHSHNLKNGLSFCYFCTVGKKGLNFLTELWLETRLGFGLWMQRQRNCPNSRCTHYYLSRPRGFNKKLSNWKIMTTAFWDYKGILLMEFMS